MFRAYLPKGEHYAGKTSFKDVDKQVRDILFEQLGTEPKHMTRHSTLVEDLGADDLDVIEVGMALEERFGRHAPPYETNMPFSGGPLFDKSVGQISKHIHGSLHKKAFVNGFLKRASEHGLEKEALNILNGMKPKGKYGQNAPGRFWVDNQCIDCDLCRQCAPANFNRSSDEGHAFVSKQPTTPKELKQCQKAKNACPVEAIHG